MNKTLLAVLGVLVITGGGCLSSSLPTENSGLDGRDSFGAAGGSQATSQPKNQVDTQQKEDVSEPLVFPGELPAEKIENKQVRMETDKGIIIFELFADTAPLTVSNFVYLTEDNYYNDLTFHRREEGFVIQGGDPNGNGSGGPDYRFADELKDEYNYDRGIVAMANSGPNTNGSQFFIMLKDTPLPKSYTIFGRVTSGLDVVDEIGVGDKMTKVTIEELGE